MTLVCYSRVYICMSFIVIMEKRRWKKLKYIRRCYIGIMEKNMQTTIVLQFPRDRMLTAIVSSKFSLALTLTKGPRRDDSFRSAAGACR